MTEWSGVRVSAREVRASLSGLFVPLWVGTRSSDPRAKVLTLDGELVLGFSREAWDLWLLSSDVGYQSSGSRVEVRGQIILKGEPSLLP